jgi:nucleoside-diphosphate-sugar epimerase
MIGSGKNRYQLLDVEDLCEAIYLTLALPETQVNDTFNVGAAEFTTMKEDYQAVLDYAGYGLSCVGAAPPSLQNVQVKALRQRRRHRRSRCRRTANRKL